MASAKVHSRKGGRHHSRFTARHAEPTKGHPLDKRPIGEIWRDYVRTRSMELRNYLMEKYLPLVRYNAERIHQRLPDEVDIEDLMSVGIFGLNDAIDAFDLDREVKFETYCAPRIRGAILDELRSMDWVPRLVRSRSAKFEQARQRIEMNTGTAATDDEVASTLGVDSESLEKYCRDGRPKMIRSIHGRCFPTDSGRDVREIDVIRDESQVDPQNDSARRDLKELVTKGLSRAERLIVQLYYFENMTMREIGATLDLSESRVSQMHTSILARLKAHLRHREGELEAISGH